MKLRKHHLHIVLPLFRMAIIPSGRKFNNSIENTSKDEFNFSGVQDRKMAHFTNLRQSKESVQQVITSCVSRPATDKPFSIIGDPAFSEAKEVLDAFVKNLRKSQLFCKICLC